ncbi:MAG: nucleotidyltransferase family protein [Firmicutes bacterium]|nr:nucleotidyltransferase family protein [Bacillota bacterium]
MLSAVILAAGKSTRMGRLKQLLPWRDDKTIVEAVTDTILACPEIDDTVRVIVGAGADTIRPLLEKVSDPRLEVLENRDYASGMLSSIQRGVAGLPATSAAFLLALGDQPLVGRSVLATLIRCWQEERPDILVPVYNGRRGHPVLFGKSLIPEIQELTTADKGLRELLLRYPQRVRYLDLAEESIVIDLDTPGDYVKYRPHEEQE